MADDSVPASAVKHKLDPNGFYVYVLFRSDGSPFYVGKWRSDCHLG